MEPSEQQQQKKKKQQQQKKKQVQSFLESSFKEGIHVMRVDIDSLYGFVKPDEPTFRAFSGALSFALSDERHRGFRYVCFCSADFASSELVLQHALKDHFESLDFDLEEFLISFKDFPQEWDEKLFGCSWIPIDVDAAALASCGTTTPDWDVSLRSKDRERTLILGQIGVSFQTLRWNRMLYFGTLNAMLGYATGVVRGLPSAGLLEKNGVDESSTLCFRCLDAPQLRRVRDILWKLCKKFGVEDYDEKSWPDIEDNVDDGDDMFLKYPRKEFTERVDLDRARIVIYIDRWLRLSDDNSSGEAASCDVNAEAMASWLYDGPLVEDVIKFQNQSEARTRKVLKKLHSKLKNLSKLRDHRDDLTRYEKALRKVELKCKKREIIEEEHMFQNLEALLEECKLEDQSCMDATTQIHALEAATAIKSSGNRDDDDDTATMTKVLANAKEEANLELHMKGAEITRNLYDIRQLKKRLESVSRFHYLTVVMPIVKRYLQVEVDNMAEAFARKKDKQKSL